MTRQVVQRLLLGLALVALPLMVGAGRPLATHPNHGGDPVALDPTGGLPASAIEHEVVWRTNLERERAGVPPLKLEPLLTAAARGHSQDMADNDFFSHTGSDGSTPWDRIERAGYTGWSALAENIAAGYDSPGAVVAGWMGSKGHRENLLNPAYREVGVGYSYLANDQGSVNYSHYWTQDFGARFDVYPVVIEDEQISVTRRTVDLYGYGSGWAQEMRLSNDGGTWSSWQPYQERLTWTLSDGNGLKSVFVELRQGSTVTQARDEVVLEAPCQLPLDLNADGRVDAQDVAIVVAAWHQSAPAGDERDANRDGRINILDISEVASEWNTSCP
ncbi:MAG: CAP domain-containing protein [Ardenticatenaceae bacterium]|nr:CAP domain-containing protein [Ardenticatenaceae bacterium]HBY98652.1 CAP domain-containing protein [Chloroflexota bacterium]